MKITYKSPLPATDENIMARRELETSIGDYDTMQEILEALGYYPGLFYEKYRTVYILPDYPSLQIMLDELPYGNFIEIEGDIDEIKILIDKFELPEENRMHTNYAGLFVAIKEAQQLDVEHVRFADFADIEIDTTIFASL